MSTIYTPNEATLSLRFGKYALDKVKVDEEVEDASIIDKIMETAKFAYDESPGWFNDITESVSWITESYGYYHSIQDPLVEGISYEPTTNGAVHTNLSTPDANRSKSYAIEIPGIQSQVALRSGVLLVIGGTGSGKTTFLRRGLLPSIEKAGQEVRYHTFVEEVDGEEKSITSPMELLANMSHFILRDPREIMAIDSFRFFMYEGGGGTGKGGTNMSLFAQLTQLDQIMSRVGKLCIITLNPLAVDDQIMKMIVDSAESSVKTVIALTSRRTATLQVRNEMGRSRKDFGIPDLSDPNTNASEASGQVGPSIDLHIDYDEVAARKNQGGDATDRILRELGSY